MDENTAWSWFKHTGNISDYLLYSQCKQRSEEPKSQEDRNEDRHRGIGDPREKRG